MFGFWEWFLPLFQRFNYIDKKIRRFRKTKLGIKKSTLKINKSTNMLISENHINPAIDDKVLIPPYSFSGNFSVYKF